MQESEQETRTIFVGNLSEKVTEEILYELFLQSGPIERVSIPKDRNFGFVTYTNEISVAYAIQLFLGTRLYGKEMALKNRNINNTNSRDNPRLSNNNSNGNHSRDIRGSHGQSPVSNSLRFGSSNNNPSANLMPKNFSSNFAAQTPLFTPDMLLRMGNQLMVNPYANFQQHPSPPSQNTQGRNDNVHRHQKYTDRRDKPYERRRSRSSDRRNNRNGGRDDRQDYRSRR